MRHGRWAVPLQDRFTARELPDWFQRYDGAGIADGDVRLPALVALACDALRDGGIIITSDFHSVSDHARIQAQIAEAVAWVESLSMTYPTVIAIIHANLRGMMALPLRQRGWRRERGGSGRAHWGC